METWRIGEIEIIKVVDIVNTVPLAMLIVEATPENLMPCSWLKPHFLDEAGNMPLSIHTFVIKTKETVVVVDTCIGNHKPRGLLPEWNMRQGQYLDDLARCGVVRDAVDTVLCTHLHVDHVVWNTMLVDGRWQPTFPKASYLFGRTEWAFWEHEDDPFGKEAKQDSFLPIFEAGQAVLVESDHRIAPAIQLIPTPGHTPGHVSVLVESKEERAVITGDLMHHPVQVARPHWQDISDVDQEQAYRTRLAFLERCYEERTLVLGSHFATPTAGRIIKDGSTWRFAV